MKNKLCYVVLAISVLFGSTAQAQSFEAVYSMEGVSSGDAKSALDDLFTDDAMKGAKVTLYAADFGVADGSLKLVADYASYDERDERDNKRRASHGWSRYLLAMHDADTVAAEMAGLVVDYGKPRHTAGYLLVYLVNVQDPTAYVAAMGDLNKAEGNPGVLRIVALRTGNRGVTHAVLIGGENFASVQKYMDKLFASDAFRSFSAKVSGMRSVVQVESYRRVGAWGY